jgi:hypothetical protein
MTQPVLRYNLAQTRCKNSVRTRTRNVSWCTTVRVGIVPLNGESMRYEYFTHLVDKGVENVNYPTTPQVRAADTNDHFAISPRRISWNTQDEVFVIPARKVARTKTRSRLPHPNVQLYERTQFSSA